MCGISGVFSNDKKYHLKISESIITLSHRGTDNTSVENITDKLSFAHSRLSIVDLHPRSNQPMTDEETGNKIILNGEVYNYKELKKLFPKKEFRTNSDTEVLMHLLREKSIKDSLKMCNGAFAFAFWDNVNKKLILGRDRFGKKPLFYSIIDNTLLFASEAKALFPFGINKKPNHKAIINYLFEGVIGKNEYSFFEGINQIQNSSYYIFSLEREILRLESKETFWSAPSSNVIISYKNAVEEFRELFLDAVRIRLSEEVKFAIMLSGGLDSSSIASVAAKYNSDRKITVISAVYNNNDLDESDFARKVTDKYKNLDTIWVDDIDYDNFLNNIENVTYHQEIPVPDGSIVAQSILMQRIAEKGIKVVLSGIGGDEVLAGYPDIFYPAQVVNEMRNIKFNNLSSRAIFHSLPNSIKNYIYVKKHLKLDVLKDKSLIKFFNKRFQSEFFHTDKLNEYLKHSLFHWTIPNMVWFEDRSSMASAVENRSPFLDYRITDFLLTLPGSFKIDKEFTKKILRDAEIGILPDEIRTRKDKQGFHAPIKKWKQLMTFKFLNDKVFKKTFDYLDFKVIEKSTFNIFWRTYSLHLWYKIFFK